MTWLPPAITPVVLLLISNVFMTFAGMGNGRGITPAFLSFPKCDNA